MSDFTIPDRSERQAAGGRLAAEISNNLVGLLRRYAGRGPTQARTTIGRDHVLVILRDTLTPGEQTLAGRGDHELVLQTRRAYQRAMREEAVPMVERLTGRTVVGFMSDNHLDPDLAAEVFVFAPDGDAMEVSEGDSG